MSKLQQQINNDLKQAMRNKQEQKVSVFRMLISAIKNKEIAARKGEDVSLTNEQVIQILRSEIKKRKDSITAYKQGDRYDLADKEEREIKIIEKYLPEQMSDGEIETVVREIVETHGNASVQKDFGKVMGQVMVRVKGQADGGKVSGVVKRVLAG
ncbi:GatB/YqeY domain-containing protein [Candidatus Parcubacteria bacterium]|nr:GatB/YqeY domain-containing protein [Candidatus Parcubacteria bacterium]